MKRSRGIAAVLVPENGIRDLGLDRRWEPYLATPFFSTGRSTVSKVFGTEGRSVV